MHIYFVISKTFERLNAFRFALRSIAKQHAISRACIKHAGGAEIFFKRFPTLDFETFAATWAVEMFGGMIENAITRNLEILEVVGLGY